MINAGVWEFIETKFSTGIPVILLYVLHSEGSSPGRQGFKMAVAADSSMKGSIGGGIMEHKFVEKAKVLLHHEEGTDNIYRQVHSKETSLNQSGMICSGEQTLWMHTITENDITAINQLVTSSQNKKTGTLTLSNKGMDFTQEITPGKFHFQQQEKDFILKEKIGFENVIHIIGGGHCSLALSRLMSDLNFYIHVYDTRNELNTIAENIYAHEKRIVQSYSECETLIESGENAYVVIMTFGYRTDDIALRALFHKQFKYIGLLGSRKKIEKMFAEYRSENIPEKILIRIHAPVGLPIKSETPAEIAISIAAQIIQEKNI